MQQFITNWLSLKGKNIVISGGSAGIGREIAKVFFAAGANVAILGTNINNLQESQRQLEELRVTSLQRIITEVVNVADKKQVDVFANHTLSLWGDIDVLVNNAGITRDKLLLRMEEEDFDSVIAVNLKSAYSLCKAFSRSLLRKKEKNTYCSIINIVSVVGMVGNAGQLNYAASKGGLIAMTKSLAQEFATRNVLVNAIAPGYIETRMTEKLPSKALDAIMNKIPLKRFGSTEDIAKAALFLASDLSNYVTGQVVVVDGGMVM